MQTYKVVISDLAKADLQNIVSYISEAESITTAKYVERGILSEMKRLKHFPTAFPKDEYASADEKTIRFRIVNCDGLEPTTSALSRQRSEPTELTIPKDSQRYNKVSE